LVEELLAQVLCFTTDENNNNNENMNFGLLIVTGATISKQYKRA
jgi:hypothetical protein